MDFLSKSFRKPLIAVDLGTVRTRMACGTLPLLESPSMVEGRHALRHGVVVDRNAAVNILKPLIRIATKRCFSRPCAIACVPTDADERERAAVIDCLTEAGAQSAAATCHLPMPIWSWISERGLRIAPSVKRALSLHPRVPE